MLKSAEAESALTVALQQALSPGNQLLLYEQCVALQEQGKHRQANRMLLLLLSRHSHQPSALLGIVDTTSPTCSRSADECMCMHVSLPAQHVVQLLALRNTKGFNPTAGCIKTYRGWWFCQHCPNPEPGCGPLFRQSRTAAWTSICPSCRLYSVFRCSYTKTGLLLGERLPSWARSAAVELICCSKFCCSTSAVVGAGMRML